MTEVKICGLRTAEAARTAARIGADYAGFVFAPSKRQVTAAEARALIAAMRESGEGTKAVGVFVNLERETLVRIMAEAPLQVVQLHGQETPELCRWVKETFPGVRVWKASPIASGDSQRADLQDAVKLRLDRYAGVIDALLIDTHDPVYGGGSGKTFAWEVIPAYLAWCRQHGIPLLAAGGLTPDNVGELAGRYAVDGVDVSSGVETDGMKDLDKMRSFVERVRRIV
ncbi:phosphoribosylanthranilate isomerase [Paenibacillus ginsengihumi]|uniref:phosphoribosylanthranilate isomerase n=1 Tax=Paenibacillus ginsengihumi TaxID=431596 RepID=UPI0003746E52|nr:phosphoribosylanthranilate isomerase [Paenibacillus ginsengihumi]